MRLIPLHVDAGGRPSGHIIGATPSSGNKGSAARFVAAKYGIPSARTVWTGDSENDLPMLDTGFRGIAVGNATAGTLLCLCFRPDVPISPPW